MSSNATGSFGGFAVELTLRKRGLCGNAGEGGFADFCRFRGYAFGTMPHCSLRFFLAHSA